MASSNATVCLCGFVPSSTEGCGSQVCRERSSALIFLGGQSSNGSDDWGVPNLPICCEYCMFLQASHCRRHCCFLAAIAVAIAVS